MPMRAENSLFLAPNQAGRYHLPISPGKILAWRGDLRLLDLLRLPRAIIAVSVVLAGYGLFRFYAHTDGNLRVVPYLLASGAFLAMADSAWNLIFKTAAENEFPEGPSGGLSTGSGYIVAGLTTLAGLMCAMTGGYGSFRAAGLMVIAILARAALFRRTEVVSPLLHGLGAGLLFVIGMTAHPSFMEMLYIREARLPPAFYAVFTAVTAVLAQVRDSSKPREGPASDDLDNDTASHLLTLRGDVIDRSVVWFGGAALVVIPLAAAWIMPWRWLSWTLLGVLALSTVYRLIPVLVYRTRRDLDSFIVATGRGGVFLNAGVVASLGDYQYREVHDGWGLAFPANDELAIIAIIILLSLPAWFLRGNDIEDE